MVLSLLCSCFTGHRNDLNTVMRGPLKSRTCGPISSSLICPTGKLYFNFITEPLSDILDFVSQQQDRALGSLNKSKQDSLFYFSAGPKQRQTQEVTADSIINLTMAHEQHSKSQFSCTSSAAPPNAMQTVVWLCCCSKKNSSWDFLFCTFSPPFYWQGN